MAVPNQNTSPMEDIIKNPNFCQKPHESQTLLAKKQNENLRKKRQSFVTHNCNLRSPCSTGKMGTLHRTIYEMCRGVG